VLSDDRRAAGSIAAMALLWGSIGVVIRQVDLPAVPIVWGRVVLAAPALAWFVARRTPGRWRWRPTRLMVADGVLLAIHWTTFVAALQRAPIGTVLLITYLAPVGIAALAPVTLHETVSLRIALALGLGVGGVALIALPSIDSSSADGVALAVVTGVVYVGLALLNKRLTADYGGAELALWQVLIAAVLLAPLAATSDWGSPGASWLWLPVLGVLYTAFAFGTYLWALAHVTATRAIVLLYLEPASAIVYGWVLLHERPSLLTGVGGAAIVGAGMLVLRSPTDELVAAMPPAASP